MQTNQFLGLLLFISVLAGYSCSGSDEEPVVPTNPVTMNPGNELDDAPDFSLETTSGSVITNSQFEGKNLVIFFFGYNCPPCVAVGPDVESRLHQEFKDNTEFAIIGADQWEGNDAGVDNFEASTGVTFPLGRNGADMAKDFGTTYDRMVVVNKEGKIVYRGTSIVANNLDEVIDIVKGLLN